MAVRTNGQIHHLTREEAIKLHRELWDRIAKECEEAGVESLDNLAMLRDMDYYQVKFKHIDDMGYAEVTHGCFVCDYAKRKEEAVCGYIRGRKCSYCPINWNASSCLHARYEFMKATDVKNLPEKEE